MSDFENTLLGDRLRAERMRRGMDLNTLAAKTKIRRDMLEAIERNQFDCIPGGAYRQSFLRQYAHALGLDEDEAVAAFRQQYEEPILPLPTPPKNTRPRRILELGWLLAIAVAVLGIYKIAESLHAATAWNVMGIRAQVAQTSIPSKPPTPSPTQTPTPPPVQSPSQTPTPLAAQTPVPSPPLTPTPSPVQKPPQSPSQTPPPLPSQAPLASPALTPPPLPAQAPTPSPARTPTPSPSQTLAASPAPDSIGSADRSSASTPPMRVTFTATEPVWLSVKCDGNSSYTGVLIGPESKTFEASKAVTVLVGNAGGVAISLNGKSIGSVGAHGEIRSLEITPSGAHPTP